MLQSLINKDLNEEYLRYAKENQKYDRKSAKKDIKEIANHIAGFANADGGTLAIGITDDGKLEGFENYGNKDNDILKSSIQYLKTIPEIKTEKLNIINNNGHEDFILLLHIEISHNCLIRNVKDEVYLRRGDSTIKLTDEQIQVLKVDRPEVSYENQVVLESSIEDIDEEMVNMYKKSIGAENKENIEVLKARHFLKEINGSYHLTNAGVLLFSNDPTVFFPCARLRVIKYSGNNMQTGENLNIIKEETFRLPIYKLIIEAQKFIRSQLRDFNHLNQDGIFEKVPEYPEFAWLEGITNAVTHRNYAMLGEHIKVFIFDDKMEIRSPGKLPGLVTLENMKNVRYARNTKISETLVDLGLVKELNEGVSRIYEEMNKFFLDEPEYTYEDGDILKLTLKNNIVMRDKRVHETLQKNEKIKNNWDLLSPIEKDILRFINDRGEAGTSDLMNYTGRSKNTVIGMLKKLEDLEIIEWNGTNNFDPKKKYIIKS